MIRLIESNLYDGPIYFSYFPISLFFLIDKSLADVLTINIQTKSYDMKKGSQNINLTYRIYYKLMNTISLGAKNSELETRKILISILSIKQSFTLD